MTRSVALGEAEQLILLATWRVGNEATGAKIRVELADRGGRTLTVSSIYVTLMRLQRKGYVQSRLADPTPVRGGKAKRYFTVTKQGVAALREARERMERMWEGMDTASDLKHA
ncbi:MAG: PadR family transcriptional regulator [Gemmatimonadota bacterium]|nr:MAG: PadR family transcriptional regulator [Gemmatimonadota bacterium]